MLERSEFDNLDAWQNRGYLPHYDFAGKYQMITYRLADSLPLKVLNAGSAGVSPAKNTHQRKLEEKYLDKGYGSCILKIPAVAEIVTNAWKHFDGSHYDIIA